MIRLDRVLVCALVLASSAARAEDDAPKGPLRLVDEVGSVGTTQTKVKFVVRNDLTQVVRELRVRLTLQAKDEALTDVQVRSLRGPWKAGARDSEQVTAPGRISIGGKSDKVDAFEIELEDALVDRQLEALLALENSGETAQERTARQSVGLVPWHPRAAQLAAAAKADAAFLAAVRAEAARARPAGEAEAELWLNTRDLVAEILGHLGGPEDLALIAGVLAQHGETDPEELVSGPALGAILRARGPQAFAKFLAALDPKDGAVAQFAILAAREAWPRPSDFKAFATLPIPEGLLASAIASDVSDAARIVALAWMIERRAAGDAEAARLAATIPADQLAPMIDPPAVDLSEPRAEEAPAGTLGLMFRAAMLPLRLTDLRSDAELPAAVGAVARVYVKACQARLEEVSSVRDLGPLLLALSPEPSDALDAAMWELAPPLLASGDPRHAGWLLETLAKRAKAPDLRGRIADVVSARAELLDGEQETELLAVALRIEPNSPGAKARVASKESARDLATTLFWGFWLALAAVLVFAARSGRQAFRTNCPCDACGADLPTLDATLRFNIGLVIARRTGHLAGQICKRCLSATFWKYQATLAFLGWWGMVSLVVTPFFFALNLWHFARAWYLPTSSAPGVVTSGRD